MDKTTMDIAFAISDSYSQHCCTAMASILYNNKGYRFRFHILSDIISEQNKAKLSAIGKPETEYEVIYHTIQHSVFKDFDMMLGRISHHGYYRYIIADLLPETDKCLYLDSDIVVNGSLYELWNTDIESYYCAGVEDIGADDRHKECLGLTGQVYINSGMLLLNLKKIREDGIVPKLFETTHEVLGKGLEYIDQDTINCVFRNKILTIPSIWNFTKKDSLRTPELCSKAIVIHYTEDRKPWLPDHYSRHAMRRLYFKYLKMTPYRSYIHEFRRKRFINRLQKPFEPLFKSGKK